MSHEPRDVARRFAAALDAEDYAAAGMLLASGCIYRINDAVIIGADAIIRSYRVNGEAGRQRFDAIEYVSVVEAGGPLDAVILFTDRLRRGSETHEFHCRQHVRLGCSGLIEEIVHDEDVEERRRLQDFESRVG